MRHNLKIELSETEGALMRLIGLIERRGFAIETMDKSEARDGHATVAMEVAAREGARRIDVLTRQIARLFDVRAVFAPGLTAVPATAMPPGSRACPQRH